MRENEVKIQLVDIRGEKREIWVERGGVLREQLMKNRSIPYKGIFRTFNCRGLGICGTCKVWVAENGSWWERRSCQIQCFDTIEVRLNVNFESSDE